MRPRHAADLERGVVELVEEHVAAVAERPDSGELHGRLGLVYAANELWTEAAASLEIAARLDPSQPLWRYHRALALATLGDGPGSLALLAEVARELPEAAFVELRLGGALVAEGRVEEAVPHLERALALAPERAEVQAALGAARLALGAPEAALEYLERAVALDPEYRSAHYSLGLAYRELGLVQQAERELSLGLEGRVRFLPDPLTAELRRYSVAWSARLQHALSLLEGGKPERAARLLEKLREEEPQDITVLNDLAIALQRLGDLEGAQQQLAEARRLDESVVSTWINLSALALEQGTTARALEHAERAVELAPDLGKTHLARARVLLRMGQLEEAHGALARSAALDPRSAEALEALGRTALELGRFEEARAHFGALARLAPSEAGAHLGLSDVALRRGEREEAARELELARARAPDHPGVIELARRLEEP